MPSASEASWHPAFMPNSNKDRTVAQRTEVKTVPINEPFESSKPDTPPPSSTLDAPDSLPEAENAKPQQEVNVAGQESSVVDDAPISTRESEEGNASGQESLQIGASSTTAREEISDLASGAHPHDNKHSSTMSFARTISGAIDFGEDDEVDSDWNVNPIQSDPFANMAPMDRSNSFPPVPPAHVPVGNGDQLPRSQADDILKETAQESRDLFGDEDDIEDSFFAQAGDSTRNQSQQDGEDQIYEPEPSNYGTIFGETVGREEDQQLEARFEEGLPLVQSEDAFDGEAGNLLGEDDAVDFFAQTQSPEDLIDRPVPHMERKSTMQIIGSMNFQPHEKGEDSADEEAINSQRSFENATSGGIAPLKDSNESDLLAEKWKAVLNENEFLEDDDELLPDDDEVLATESKPLDPADLFGSDDEGFLEDSEEISPSAPDAPTDSKNQPQVHQSKSSNRYLPADIPSPVLQNNSYAPSPVTPNFQHVQQARPEIPKAQSFADKSKGGYSSPYDLPMEVVKPRKRPVSAQTNKAFNAPLQAPPPRSSSMYSDQSTTSMSPPTSSHSNDVQGQQPQQPQQPPQQPPQARQAVRKTQSGFFEELPMAVKPRQVRHASSFVSLSPSSQGPPINSPQLPPGGLSPYSQPVQQGPPSANSITGLVAPQKVSPYAPLPTGNVIVPPMASRYSPAPPTSSHTAPPPPVAQSRYSPAPPTQRQQPINVAHTVSAPPQLPHQPRTSSPLAHFERSQDPRMQLGDSHGSERRSSSSYESNLRTSHLPPTNEVDENEASSSAIYSPPIQGIRQASQTPPPLRHSARSTMSPPKRVTSNYLPQQQNQNLPQTFAPPKRSQTQSPGGGLVGPRLGMSSLEPYQRPASVELPSSPRHSLVSPPIQMSTHPRPRGFSQSQNYVAPTDGREHDPLQRWRGSPVFAWGVGGTFVTTFPQVVQRYGMSHTTPMAVRSPGEVKVRNIKDIYPLPERLTSFPGPLKGKSKKKEVVAWLTAGISILEDNASYLHTVSQLSHQDKRVKERILLWKLLRVFIENDGLLEGNLAVDKAVRDILSPGIEDPTASSNLLCATGANLSGISASSVATTDPIDPTTIDQLRQHLLRGEREKAVWEAVDKRLWAHALLISNTVSRELYKQVSQEFVQKEVKNIGQNTESLAALYDIFSGNFEESIDELVPPSARAGFQMVSTSKIPGSSKDALEGLDRWRETLGLVLSNRSPDDCIALNALGKLLSGYGRAEAAHICFLFARSHTLFGGIDDPAAHMVLVGADHLRQPNDFDREIEPIILSEVFEYGMSLSNTSSVALSIPHLSIYKLHHASVLAENGQRDKALQYCDAIAASMTYQTRRSPYHHPAFVTALEDFSKRLKQSPKDGGSSWIPKPTMDKVGGSLLATFNKFVAGGDGDETASTGSGAGSDIGPFARIAGGTPTISRSPSQSDLYGYGAPTNGIPIPASKAASRYAPGVQYTPPGLEHQGSWGSQPRSSFEGISSNEFRRLDPQRKNSDYRPTSQPANNYAPPPSLYNPQSQYSPYSNPDTTFESGSPHQPHMMSPVTEDAPSGNAYELPQPPISHSGLQQSSSDDSQPSSRQASAGYEPPSSYEPQPTQVGFDQPSSGGYKPPSTYEPPSSSGYVPYEPAADDDEPDSPVETRPKKKSFMDDDEDDIPALKQVPAQAEKTKAEKDRETDEAFRRAAEADAAKSSSSPAKKGWGLSGWWGGAKKEPDTIQPNKPIRAKLGEESSFYFDPELKRWVNKKGGDSTPTPSATPPPPKAGPSRSASGNAPPPSLSRPSSSSGGPPRKVSDTQHGTSSPLAQSDGTNTLAPPNMARSISNGSVGSVSRPPSAPPSRPGTGMSNASSIDDLLGPAMMKRAGAKGTAKSKKKGRGYIDVMNAEK